MPPSLFPSLNSARRDLLSSLGAKAASLALEEQPYHVMMLLGESMIKINLLDTLVPF